ncbi:hypothetical protein SKB0092_30250 [Roseomonas mucosa]
MISPRSRSMACRVSEAFGMSGADSVMALPLQLTCQMRIIPVSAACHKKAVGRARNRTQKTPGTTGAGGLSVQKDEISCP